LTLEAVVLPGGHVFTDTGAPQFNYAEIPSHLLPMVQEQIAQPPPRRPPPTDETPLRLIIPRLNVDQTIIQGVDWEAMRQGIGQLPNGTTPVDPDGNIVLAAHNDIYGEYFRHLDQLVPGDQFQIQTSSRIYTYTVQNWDIYEPTDVHVMESRGAAVATLISCYPYQVNNKRIVVFATLNA
jgi:sortase A